MSMPAPAYFTAEMVRALPEDGNRYEVVHGELLVTPAPRRRHQRLLAHLFYALRGYLVVHPVGEVLWSPADIVGDAGTLVQPDLFVAPAEADPPAGWPTLPELLLVVEVLSPSTTRQDRFSKRRRYQEAGVPMYWIVDGEAKQVEVWTPAALFPVIERDRLVWRPAGAGDAFRMELGELFGPA